MVSCTTCGVVPWWQADGLLKETQLRVVKSESLINNVRCWLHIHLADGHRLAIVCFECYLWRKGEGSAALAARHTLAWCSRETAYSLRGSNILCESQTAKTAYCSRRQLSKSPYVHSFVPHF